MKIRFWMGGACLLLAGRDIQAETPPEVPLVPVIASKKDETAKEAQKPAIDEAATPKIDPILELLPPVEKSRGPRVWANAEALLWWMKAGPIPPLVTRGNPNDTVPGAIGQPGTHVLYGGFPGSANFGGQGGIKFDIGAWLDDDQTLGFETGAIIFGAKSGGGFFANGDFLYLPSRDGETNGPSTYIVSDSIIGYSGYVTAVNEMRFWGIDGNSLIHLYRGGRGSIRALGGLRYLDLAESLTMTNYSADNMFGGSTTVTDAFRTRNQFLGGQLGLQADVYEGKFFASLRSSVALGGTHQSRDARGWTTGDASPAGTFPHGYYVQPSNSGRITDNDFSVVPQIGLQLGMDLMPNIRLFAGYDFLYWSNVMRPGDQIDSTVNISQSYGRTLSGPARPTSITRNSDFWAHGVNLGLQLRY